MSTSKNKNDHFDHQDNKQYEFNLIKIVFNSRVIRLPKDALKWMLAWFKTIIY